MTNDKIRIAMAEACGWTRVEWYEDNAGPPILHGFPPPELIYADSGVWDIKEQKHTKHVPDFCNDLNAINTAEACFHPDHLKSEDYCYHLTQVVYRTKHSGTAITFQVINAVAIQRCEAFLRTIGKWEE